MHVLPGFLCFYFLFPCPQAFQAGKTVGLIEECFKCTSFCMDELFYRKVEKGN